MGKILRQKYGHLENALDERHRFGNNLNDYTEHGRFIIQSDFASKPKNLQHLAGILEVYWKNNGTTTYIIQCFKSDAIVPAGVTDSTGLTNWYTRTSPNIMGTNWTPWVQHINSEGGQVDKVLRVAELILTGNFTQSDGQFTINGPAQFNNDLTIGNINNRRLVTFYGVLNCSGTGSSTGVAATYTGEVRADFFRGTAYRAWFGDIAEKYTIDPRSEFQIGTVIEINSEDNNYDVCVCNKINSSNVIGVVSNSAAMIMDNDLSGSTVTVGLLGKVPVLVKGPIHKGQKVVSSKDGHAIAYDPEDSVSIAYPFGIALESNLSDNVKLVKCLIK